MWQFSQAIDGISEACTALGTPITGGNVSFYNETLGRSIDPTPVLGVLGMIEDAERALGMGFRAEGDVILLLDGADGATSNGKSDGRRDGKNVGEGSAREFSSFSSSEYARTIHGVIAGQPPAVDLAAEKALIAALVALAADGSVQSAHDVSDGGLAVTIAESCLANETLSAHIALSSDEPDEAALFGERGARAVVSVTPLHLERVLSIAAQYGVAARDIGRVVSGDFRIELNGRAAIHSGRAVVAGAWMNTFERLLRTSSAS